MNRDRLRSQLRVDEGERLKPYKDTVGKTTVGVGRNLDDRGIRPSESAFMLENDIDEVVAELNRALPWWKNLTDARQEVLANMCFNLGLSKLLGFKNTLAFMEAGRYDAAADGMKNSMWAKQVGARADRLITMMRNG